MTDSFDLPVMYKGEELLLPAQLLQLGYTHTFKVDVNGTEVLFEPDEERSYRAVMDPALPDSGKKIETGLLQATAAAIEAIVK